jgi:hypothetical protein
MDPAAIALILIVALVAFGLVILALTLRQTTDRALADSSGLAAHRLDEPSGYELRSLPLSGKDLNERVAFQLKPLTPEQRASFVGAWAELEREFEREPASVVQRANRLALQVMQARGYPVSDAPVFDISEQAELPPSELGHTMLRYRVLLEAILELPARNPARPGN